MKNYLLIFICLIFITPIFSQESNAPTFTSEEVVEDIDYLLDTLEEYHPTFPQHLSDSFYREKVKKIKSDIKSPMTKYEFFMLMQPIVSVDSHTSLKFNGKIQPEIEAPLLPIKVIIHDNQIYVRENLSSNDNITKGMIIDSINGKAGSTIINNINRYIPADKDKASPAKTGEVFHVFYRLIYGNSNSFDISLNNNGRKFQTKVSGVKFDKFKEPPKEQFDYKKLDKDIAYLRIGKFRKPDYFMTYIDSVFCDLKANNIQNLIIDKRDGGGLTNLADSLLTYLTDTPYRRFKKMKMKISSSNKDFIQENRNRGYIKDGYLVIEEPEVLPPNRKNIFKGETYILMGPDSKSAATYFVSIVKANEIATLVGREAGQPLISNGGLHSFKLPNTKMKCYSSMSTYYLLGAKNNKESVKPDYKVELSAEDLLDEEDEYLNSTLNLIEEHKPKQ